ncbi:sugar transporter SWEET1 isoform X2 [Pyrgilauda ruficollis]|uniref:sugar transporter SWEET1 isoform X2 n=1 Tax=Pyrgilauda ruficollis TaxID=221976 RepID=UPI001B86348D|nr:sugar transporter SWEET1 isoform X2 [Pyrgilauda ruficollis]
MALSVLAGICLAATLAMFATGLSDLRQMLATKSVENIQFLPFLTTDANNLSWLGYGCLKGDGTVITVNAIGAALQTLYILVYLYYSPVKRPVLLQVLLLLAVVVTGCGYFTILVDTGTRLTHLGLFCSVFTISMYLSPLADLVPNVPGIVTSLVRFWLFQRYRPEQDKPYSALPA